MPQTKYWLSSVALAVQNRWSAPSGYELRISDHVPHGTYRAAYPWENEYITDSERRRGLEWPECLFVPIESDGTCWTVRDVTKDGVFAIVATAPDGASISLDDAVLGHGATEDARRAYYSDMRDAWNYRVGQHVFNGTLRKYAT